MSDPRVISPRLRPEPSWRSRASMTSDATAEISISRDLQQAIEGSSSLVEAHDEDAESDSDLENLYRTTSHPGVSMVGSYRRPSLAAAGSRALLGTAPLESNRVPSRRERLQAREDQRRMLEDNDIYSTSRPGRKPSRSSGQLPSDVSSFKPVQTDPSETEPLLGANGKQADHIDADWEAAVLSGQVGTTWQREAGFLARTSLPLIATYLLQYSLTLASIFTVGHIGTVELGAASLASMTANITGYAAYYGLTTALDTLNAQAFGSGKKSLVGLQLQRMILFLWSITLPIGLVWIFADTILLRIVPEREVALLAGRYLKVLVLGLPAFAVFESTKRYLQAQGIFSASLYILLITAPLNVLCNWLFVWVFKWGFIGAPVAVVVIDNLLGILIVLYVKFVDGSECWPGLTKRALVNWGPMIKLALPGWIMVEAEFAAFELLTLASSYFGEKSLAAQSVLATLASVTFQIPFPISIAASTRIANLIGATLTEPAKVQARVLVCVEAIVGIVNVIILSTSRNIIARLFTDDARVTQLVADVIPLLAAFQVFDAQACSFNGMLRGLGKPAIGGITQLFCYYVIAMPISMGTAFGLHWELRGLWTGVAIALGLVALIECLFVLRFDWRKSVEDAKRRNESG